MEWLDQVKFDHNGLVPVVVQDASSGTVLTLAYANREALERAHNTKKACFFSRSRGELWIKGETSGNFQEIEEIRVDCDGDAVLYRVLPAGPACHQGFFSCFFRKVPPQGNLQQVEDHAAYGENPGPEVLTQLYQIIRQRQKDLPTESYVARLTQKGLDRVLQKVGEEAVEVVLAAKNQDAEATIAEMADLWFHSLVALGFLGLPPDSVFAELGKRRK